MSEPPRPLGRLLLAMAAYAALSAAACFMLTGSVRLAVLILFGYFVARTLLAHFRPRE